MQIRDFWMRSKWRARRTTCWPPFWRASSRAALCCCGAVCPCLGAAACWRPISRPCRPARPRGCCRWAACRVCRALWGRAPAGGLRRRPCGRGSGGNGKTAGSARHRTGGPPRIRGRFAGRRSRLRPLRPLCGGAGEGLRRCGDVFHRRHPGPRLRSGLSQGHPAKARRLRGHDGQPGPGRLVRRQLLEAGADPARVERLHAPIGLAIGARSAQEIALSILAQIVEIKSADSSPRASRLK